MKSLIKENERPSQKKKSLPLIDKNSVSKAKPNATFYQRVVHL